MYIGSCSEGGAFWGKAERRKNMYRIGEFSRITSLTVKALRYYDEEGILSPSGRIRTDIVCIIETDYEKARRDRFASGSWIFPLWRLRTCFPPVWEEDLAFFLKEKQGTRSGQRISKEKALLKSWRKPFPPERKPPLWNRSYTLERKTAEELLVISIRFRGKYPEVGKYAGRLFKAAGSKACGGALQSVL